jgi:hypothetical protein
MVPLEMISGENYITVCLMYIGSDAGQKAVAAWRK